MKFKNDIEAQAGIKDTTGNLGSAGELLSSTGTGVEWIAQSAVSASSDFMFYEVKNSSGATINKGKAVMAVGTDGNSGHILIDELIADGSVESRYFMGVLETTVANGDLARVIAFGELDQFNTLGQNGETWADGQVLWCSPVYPGDFTITEPQGPNLKIPAAFIMKAATNGKIQIRVQGNEGIKDLYDTKITTQADGELLVWDNTTGVWMNDDTAIIDYTNGRVGIGTTSPIGNLEVNTATVRTSVNGGADELVIQNDGYSGISIISSATTAGQIHFGDVNQSNTGMIQYFHSDNSMRFAAGDATEKMRITSTGNVGIGETSVDARLHITTATAGLVNQKFESAGSAAWRIGIPASQTYFAFDNVNDSLSAPKVVIDSSGNVGIGTTNPYQKLHIRDTSGANIILNSNTFNVSSGVYMSEGPTATPTQNGSYVYYDAVNDAFKIATGTTSLIDRLTIARDSGALKLNQYGSGTFTGTVTQRLAVDSSGNVIEIPIGSGPVDGSGAANYLARWIDTDTLGIGVAYDNGTNVGIGTTSPASSAKLTVMGNQTFGLPGNGLNTNGRFISIEGNADTSGEGSGRIFFTEHNSTTAGMDSYGMSLGYRGGSTSIVGASGNTWTGLTQIGNGEWGMFGHDNNATGVKIMQGSRSATYTAFYSSGSETMRVTGGNVGIGTTSPSTRLQVYNSTEGQYMEVGAGDAGGRSLVFTSSSNNGSVGALHTINAKSISGAIALSTAGSERMRVDQNGNVGIGTTSPGAKLQVGDGTFDANARVFHSDNTYTEMRGYGIVTNRTTNYYRPTADKTQVLAIGNDGNTWNYISHNANYHTFSTDLAERMRIDLGGNVGIGTTSPTQMLHVTGNARVTGAYYDSNNSSGTSGQVLSSTATGTDWVSLSEISGVDGTGTANYVAKWSDTDTITNSIIYDNGTNVGIGVTTFNTGERFVVSKGSIGATSLNGLNDAVIEGSGDTGLTILSPNTNYGSIAFGDPQNGAIGRIRYQHSTNAMTFNTNGSEYMRIISNGNVGIGTTSPSAKLELSGTSGQLLVLDDSSATGNPFMSFYQAGTRRSYIQHLDASDLLTLASEYGGIKFMTGTLGTEVDRVVIDSTGNVGINTTAPTEKLAVTGNIETTQSANGVKIGFNVGDSFTLNGADTAHYGLSCGVSTSVPLVLSGYYGVAIATNGLERVRILQSNGYFGILTTTPAYELDVTGTIRATGNVIAFSDARVKENIKTIDSALEKVNKLRGVEFNKIGEEKTCIGVIAQEVEEVLPEVVETDDNGMKAVAYGNMVGLLIEAMKEQQKQIDELKAKLESYGS